MAQTPMYLTAEQRAAVIDSFEAAIASQGFELYPLAQKVKAFLDKNMSLLEACLSRKTLDTELANYTVANVEVAQMYVPLLIALPSLINKAFNESVRQQAAVLPRVAGPPIKVTSEKRRQIIAYISELYLNGTPIGVAKQRAALKFTVGKRTVQRIWQHRRQFKEEPFQTMEDVLSFLGEI